MSCPSLYLQKMTGHCLASRQCSPRIPGTKWAIRGPIRWGRASPSLLTHGLVQTAQAGHQWDQDGVVVCRDRQAMWLQERTWACRPMHWTTCHPAPSVLQRSPTSAPPPRPLDSTLTSKKSGTPCPLSPGGASVHRQNPMTTTEV